jgi:DNA polymerase-1
MIAADYGQLEMRLLAAAALEQSMIDIFLRGWDIHSGNASLMYDTLYEDIALGKKLAKDAPQMDPAELMELVESKSPGIIQRAGVNGITDYLVTCARHRSDAKNIGFGLNYGMGPGKLARDLKVSLDVAKLKIEQYKRTYPAVERFMKEAIQEGRKTGYAFTVMGRRRNIPMIGSSRKDQQALGERLAVNTQIQGSAADVCKVAQLNIDAAGLDKRYDCWTVLQVHDELVFECPASAVDSVKQEIEELMAHAFSIELACPMEAEAGVGNNWGEAK